MDKKRVIKGLRQMIAAYAGSPAEARKVVGILTLTDWDRVYSPPVAVEMRTAECDNCGVIFDYENDHGFPRRFCGECQTSPKALATLEEGRLMSNLSRARSAGRPATLTLDEWISTVLHFDLKCAYCRKDKFTVMEHFIPVSKGGGTTVDNCVPACVSCNFRKRPDKMLMPQEWLDRVAAYLATLMPVA